ncbi:hypothetical protein Hdeb2414_s0003g00111871 [Helianthus debilis subsp. tardiflorus]
MMKHFTLACRRTGFIRACYSTTNDIGMGILIGLSDKVSRLVCFCLLEETKYLIRLL